MKKMKPSILFLLMFFSSFSFGSIHEFNVTQPPILNVNNVWGNITIQSGDSNLIQVVANNEFHDEVVILFNENRLDVKLPADRYLNNEKTMVNFEITVPKNVLQIYAQSIHGNVVLNGIESSFEVKTSSGQIKAINCKGELNLQTIKGNIYMDGIDQAKVGATANSGHIYYENGTFTGDAYQFSTTNGNISIIMPPNPSISIKGKTISGSINYPDHFEFKAFSSRFSSIKSIHGRLGQGFSKIEINSINGNIVIRQAQT